METLVFLESLEALVIPVVLEAPYRYIIDERLKEDKKGLKAEDVHNAADNVYDRGELLFSAYDPIFLKRPTVDALMAGDDFQHYNDRASEEEKHTIWQIHKEILSHKPGEAVTSKLFQKTVLPSFRLAMFTAYRQLEDEKDKLFQQQIAPGPPSKKVRKVTKEEKKKRNKKLKINKKLNLNSMPPKRQQ